MNYLELHNTKLFIKNNFIPFKNSFIPLDEIQKVNFALANWKPNSSSKITITYKNLKIKKYSFSEAQLSEVLRLINELESLGVNVEYKKEEWI